IHGSYRLLLSPFVGVLLLVGCLSELLRLAAAALKGEGLGAAAGSSKWIEDRIVSPEDIKDSFDSVKGYEEVKKEVREIIEYLKNPEKFQAIGAKLPKGILLHGPPGTGKTLLARAIAGEAGVPFLHASGSDFEEMFVGVGASRIRSLFAAARAKGRCLLFIDEVDAVAGSRRIDTNGNFRQTLNQLLAELDGFKPTEGIVLICATNLLGSIDSALLRPGRVDKTIFVPLPSLKERLEMLEYYASRVQLSPEVDLTLYASLTSGLTGAEVANLLNLAAIRAASSGKKEVNHLLGFRV
ncbi:atp-dependent metalloprotease ftsh, putative, partial [Eimeria tenella]